MIFENVDLKGYFGIFKYSIGQNEPFLLFFGQNESFIVLWPIWPFQNCLLARMIFNPTLYSIFFTLFNEICLCIKKELVLVLSLFKPRLATVSFLEYLSPVYKKGLLLDNMQVENFCGLCPFMSLKVWVTKYPYFPLST